MNQNEQKQQPLDGAKLVSSAIAGLDFQNIIINSKVYTMFPPTIFKIAAATSCISEIGEIDSIASLVRGMQNSHEIARALSYFIEGNESLVEELVEAEIGELVSGLEIAFTLIDVSNFIKLSVLVKSAKKLIANQTR